MLKNNRDDFNQCAAALLELLYQEFPKETDVVVDDLVKYLNEDMMDNYFATIRFLQRERLIHYQALNYFTFSGVVLTAKGLRILDTIPDSFQEKTIAQQITHALAEGSEKAIGQVIQEVIRISVDRF
jgi:hypothetical protein